MEPRSKLIPPQSIEAEEAVLSACLLGGHQDAVELIAPDDFYRTAHGVIFRAIKDLSCSGSSVELITVINKLRDMGELEKCGGAQFISRFIDTIPSAIHTENHCKIIKEKSVLRQIIKESSETISACYNNENAEDVLDRAQGGLLKIDFGGDSKTECSIGDLMVDTVDTIEVRSKANCAVTGVPTGFTRFDAMTAGLQPGDFILLAGRPSMGKTALAWQMLDGAAKNGFPGLMLELEMTKNQLGLRAIASESRVDSARVRIGRLGQTDWERITESAGRLSSLPIIVDDQAGLSLMDVRRRIRSAIKKINCKFVVIDYIQLMRVNESRSRENEIGAISRSLKTMAKEFDVPMLVLSQLNRKLEERSDKRPVLADLRDSGSLEQDADVVAFIYRDEVYNRDENNPNRGTAELIIAKQRNGPVGVVPLTFLKSYVRFENPA